ncbi:hypothetical protein VTK73DRAFT_5336 [Phialemonium thermophilum]|uniref:Glucose receptor Git3 N-terminal domain-containing protein n=1 Tax=Phialemonium thermophilum TaxID=223376 RepID=A0ABR3Y7B5_9PEZI
MTTMQNVYDSEDASGSIAPLPPVLSHGLAAVAVFGFLSFFSSLSLFAYLTYKLIIWQLQPPEEDKRTTTPEPESPTSDSNGFLVPDSHSWSPSKEIDQKSFPPLQESIWRRLRRNPPNQFLVLIYNLLFADIQQAMAFLLNVTWLSRNAVQAGTSVCWAQGWFVSTGDLASSVFISAIAVHTYLGVVNGYRLPAWAFYGAIAILWGFVYGAAILGVIITHDGKNNGGLYVRAGAWCWINSAYQNLRLTLHYLWIFLSLALTSLIYTIIFFHLHIHGKHSAACKLGSNPKQNLPGEHYPNPDPNGSGAPPSIAPSSPRSAMTDMSVKRLPPIPSSARHPTFLLYPLIYVLCTFPLAAGRIASMAGHNVSLAYFCFAGSMIASAGWLDVALYSSTRRSIVFSGEAPPSQDTGLETFAFMRTPPGRQFGNVVYVSGGGDESRIRRRRWAGWNGKVVAAARLRTLTRNASGTDTGRSGTVRSVPGSRNASKETLSGMKGFGMGAGEVMGMAIQCETVTTVVVEEMQEERTRNGSITSLPVSVSSMKL